MSLPRVVIVGGGFGGLTAARALRKTPCLVTLVDRRNHHVFQPLLYQVATAGLSPAQIAAPIREILGPQERCEVLMGEVTGIDPARRRVLLAGDELEYDYLILAAGAGHSYFGHEEWSRHAPGLKTLDDALEIRRRFLLAFERAEREPDPAARAADLTFVIVGAGPTGVELAGAMIEIAFKTMPEEFRRVDTRRARVVLVEAFDRVLPGGFPSRLSERARRDLEELGVEVRLRSRVTEIDAQGVWLETSSGRERIDARQVLWAAGVKASALGATLGAPLDRAGRVIVEPDLSIPGHPEVFVIGDLARVIDAKTGQEVPGMSPGAMQMGRHVAAIIRDEIRRGAPGSRCTQRREFVYHDKGLLATIGRARAVAKLFGREFAGMPAWLLWAGVHIVYLIGFRNKLVVMLDWAWSYIFFSRGARLITGSDDSKPTRNAPAATPPART